MSFAAGGGDVLAELVEHLIAAGGVLAGGRADLDADRVAAARSSQRLLGPLGQGFELFVNRCHNGTPLPIAGTGKHLISAKTAGSVKDHAASRPRLV